LVHTNQHSGAVGAAAVSYNIHRPPAFPNSFALCSGALTIRL
jgi:hypothetical protein